jgi:hypothetical protein
MHDDDWVRGVAHGRTEERERCMHICEKLRDELHHGRGEYALLFEIGSERRAARDAAAKIHSLIRQG